MEKITKKVAVVGCGRMGAFTSETVIKNAPSCWQPLAHAEAVRAHPGLELVALVDTRQEILSRAADFYNINSTYLSFDSLILDQKIDLICLATRTPGRAHMIELAQKAGIRAVHAEKPLCNSMRELNVLAEIFRNDNFFFTWGAIRRYLPAYQQALKWVESGDLGPLLEIKVNFGSSALFWTHAHAFDLLTFAAGARRLESIHAKFSGCVSSLEDRLVIESDPLVQFCIAEFEDGVQGFITQAHGSDFVLTCEKGELIVLSDGAELTLRQCKNSAYPITHNIPIKNHHEIGGTLAPLSLLSSCLNGDSLGIEVNRKIKQDIILSQRMMFAATYSHLTGGRKVDFSESLPEIEIWALSNGLYA